MTEKQISIVYHKFKHFTDLGSNDQNLCKAAEKALINAHAPYSEFKVGAALLLNSGRIIYGSNQENVAYPSGLCAERVALFNAAANFPDEKILAIAITASTKKFEIKAAITPCGSCLQVMAEYEKKQNSPIKTILYTPNADILVIDDVKSLLPFMFFENRLQK